MIAGRHDIAACTRWIGRQVTRLFAVAARPFTTVEIEESVPPFAGTKPGGHPMEESESVSSLSESGLWWRQDNAGHRVPGDLVLDADEFELRLDGSLFPVDMGGGVVAVRPEWRTIPVVHGRSKANRQVTLLQCEGLVMPIPDGPGVVNAESYQPQVAIAGAHLEAPVLFKRVSFSIDWLGAWAEPPPIADGSLAVPLEETVLRPRHEVLESAQLPGATVNLSSWTVGSFGAERIRLEREVSFEIELDTPTDWQGLLTDWIRPIHDLFTLLMLRPTRLTSIRVKPSGADERDPLCSMHLQLLQPAADGTGDRSLPRGRMLGSRTHPILAFDEMMRVWFEKYQLLGQAIRMLLVAQQSPFLYDENRFLTAFWSAEALHGVLFDVAELPKEEHEKRVAAILEAAATNNVDDDVVRWARAVLAGRNDKPLRQRVNDLLGHSGRVGAAIVDAEPKFVGNLTGTRGPLAHSGGGGRLQTPDRYFHSEALRWIVRACLLRELGVSADEGDRLILSRDQFRWVLKNLGAVERE